MAYRTFRNELQYEAPDIGQLPNTLRVLDSIRQQRQQQRNLQQQLANNYKSYEVTNKIAPLARELGNQVGDVTRKAQQSILSTGQIAPDVIQKTSEIKRDDDVANALSEAYEKKKQSINAADKYTKKETLLQKLDQVHAPREGKFADMANEITSVIQDVDKTPIKEKFDLPNYVHDWVTNYGTTETENDVTGRSGFRNKDKTKGRFLNANGVPEVTTDHVNQLLESDPRTKEYFYEDSLDDIKKNVAAYKASGKPLPEWAQGLDDDEIAFYVSQPVPQQEDNDRAWKHRNADLGIDPKTIGERVAEKGKDWISRYENVERHHLTDASNFNESAKYGVTSDKFNYSPGAFNGTYGGVGGTFSKKNGQKYEINSTASDRLNTSTGEMIHGINEGNRPFQVENHQLVLTDRFNNIHPIPIKSNDPTKINNEIIEYFKTLDPQDAEKLELKVGLRGQFFDATNIINAADKAAKEKREAGDVNAADEITKAARELVKMQGLSDPNDNDLYTQQVAQGILSKYIKSGVSYPEIIVPSANDLNKIKSDTGKNLLDKSQWSESEKAVLNAFDQRKKTAKAEVLKQGQEFKKEVETKTKANEKKVANPVSFKKSYTLGDKEYSLDDLKKNYSEEEIQQAIQKGLLK